MLETIEGLESGVRGYVKWNPILGPRLKIENLVLIGKNGPATGFTLPRTKPWHGNAVYSLRLLRRR